MSLIQSLVQRFLAIFRTPAVSSILSDVHAVVGRLEDAAKRHAADAIAHSATAQKFIALEQKAKTEVEYAEAIVTNIKNFISPPKA